MSATIHGVDDTQLSDFNPSNVSDSSRDISPATSITILQTSARAGASYESVTSAVRHRENNNARTESTNGDKTLKAVLLFLVRRHSFSIFLMALACNQTGQRKYPMHIYSLMGTLRRPSGRVFYDSQFQKNFVETD